MLILCVILTVFFSGAETNLKVGVGHTSGEKRRKNFLSCPSTFWLHKCKQSFWWAFWWLSVQCGQFLVRCSSLAWV